MLHCQRSLSKLLNNKQVFNFGFGKQKPPTPKNLEKYDVVFIGSNMGGLLSNQFERVTDMKYQNMVVFENAVNQVYPLRGTYEMQKMSKTDYLPNAKLAVHKNSAHSDLVGVKSIQPEQNKVTLKNGRTIEYGHLVIGAGQDPDFERIKGFDAAWAHEEHPVYAPADHPSWKGSLHKYPKYHYNFTHGNAYFCIPKFPFRGEVETYNFFISDEIWSWFKAHGKQHPHTTFTILNANEKFVRHNEAADNFIKEELAKRGIEVLYNTNLEAVDQENWTISTKDLKTNKTVNRDYHNLYSIVPTRPHQMLLDAGLASAETDGLLDVDIETLRHNKYKNIFGIGDVCNLPTTHSFWGGWQQIHVVRNNLERSINNQSLNAKYDGYTKTPLYMGQSKLTFVEHFYNEKGSWQHLKNSNDFLGGIRAKQWTGQKSKFLNYYLGKTYGPPYHKFPKKFKETDAPAENNNNNTPFKAEKKTA